MLTQFSCHWATEVAEISEHGLSVVCLFVFLVIFYHLKHTQITLALVDYPGSSVARALHQHHKGVCLIPARGLIVDTFFQLFLGWIWNVYDFHSKLRPLDPLVSINSSAFITIEIPHGILFPTFRRSTYNHLSSWLTDARNLTNPNTVSVIGLFLCSWISEEITTFKMFLNLC